MTDGIGFAVHEILVIALRGAFRPVAGAVDRHRQQGTQQTRGGRLLGEPQGGPDLGPGVAAQFVVGTDDQIRVVMTDLDRGSDRATAQGAAQPEAGADGHPLHTGQGSSRRLGRYLRGRDRASETSTGCPEHGRKHEGHESCAGHGQSPVCHAL